MNLQSDIQEMTIDEIATVDGARGIGAVSSDGVFGGGAAFFTGGVVMGWNPGGWAMMGVGIGMMGWACIP